MINDYLNKFKNYDEFNLHIKQKTFLKVERFLIFK